MWDCTQAFCDKVCGSLLPLLNDFLGLGELWAWWCWILLGYIILCYVRPCYVRLAYVIKIQLCCSWNDKAARRAWRWQSRSRCWAKRPPRSSEALFFFLKSWLKFSIVFICLLSYCTHQVACETKKPLMLVAKECGGPYDKFCDVLSPFLGGCGRVQ